MNYKKIGVGVFAFVISAVAHAGQFNTRYYGNATGDDVASEVTEEFTKYFPSAKWSIFLWTTSGITDKGIPYCNAIAGVIPRGSNEFPIHRYESISLDTSATGSKNVGELRKWSVECAKSSVNSMMSDQLKNIYKTSK